MKVIDTTGAGVLFAVHAARAGRSVRLFCQGDCHVPDVVSGGVLVCPQVFDTIEPIPVFEGGLRAIERRFDTPLFELRHRFGGAGFQGFQVKPQPLDMVDTILEAAGEVLEETRISFIEIANNAVQGLETEFGFEACDQVFVDAPLDDILRWCGRAPLGLKTRWIRRTQEPSSRPSSLSTVARNGGFATVYHGGVASEYFASDDPSADDIGRLCVWEPEKGPAIEDELRWLDEVGVRVVSGHGLHLPLNLGESALVGQLSLTTPSVETYLSFLSGPSGRWVGLWPHC